MIEIVVIRLSTRSSGRRGVLMSGRVVGYSREGRYGGGSFLRAVRKGSVNHNCLDILIIGDEELATFVG